MDHDNGRFVDITGVLTGKLTEALELATVWRRRLVATSYHGQVRAERAINAHRL